MKCIHGKRKSNCIECGGGSMCIHKKRRSYCNKCSPIYCRVCKMTYSKGYWKTHIKKESHIKNRERLSWIIGEQFDI